MSGSLALQLTKNKMAAGLATAPLFMCIKGCGENKNKDKEDKTNEKK